MDEVLEATDELREPEVALERYRMLRFIVMIGGLGFIASSISAIVMYPDAMGFFMGIGLMSGSIGFAAGRFVFRQERDFDDAQMFAMGQSIKKMEELVTGGTENAVNTAWNHVNQLEKRNRELERRLSQEREARQAAQRKLVEHLRDCDE